MQKFYGVQLCGLTNLLGQLTASITTVGAVQGHYNISLPRNPLDNDLKLNWINGTLKPMYVIAVKTNLKSTEAYIERLCKRMGGALYPDEMPALVQQLTERIEDDLKGELLLHVPKDKSKYYEPTELVDYQPKEIPLFGHEVDASFPSARFDISECGKCLALDRGTACVMHLSRVAETGLRVLAEDELGLPSRPDWGRHLKDIDDELTKRYKAAGPRSKDEMFYSEIAALLGHIKVAWRNPSMHVDRKYTEEEAENILVAIRGFMKHIAPRLKEKL